MEVSVSLALSVSVCFSKNSVIFSGSNKISLETNEISSLSMLCFRVKYETKNLH